MKAIDLKILVLVLLLASCSNTGSQVWKVHDKARIDYNFAKADVLWELDNSLQEVSGLEYDIRASRLMAVNDEKGTIYQINTQTGEADRLWEFYKDGDYEGIAKAGKHVFVLKSNGKLYRYNIDKDMTKVFDTGLSAVNDAEGLCYDSASNALLIACKGLPISQKPHEKAVYRFNLNANPLQLAPEITIDVEKLNEWAESMELSAEQQWRLKRFAPSGIAIHPLNGSYYLLSARGSMLLVLNREKRIEYMVFMDAKALPQPEGITFDEDISLYIASEGKAGKGKLLKFEVRH